jgi:hypothetical protein
VWCTLILISTVLLLIEQCIVHTIMIFDSKCTDIYQMHFTVTA